MEKKRKNYIMIIMEVKQKIKKKKNKKEKRKENEFQDSLPGDERMTKEK